MPYIMANYHTHTPRCKHASGTEREYLDRAAEIGYRILGFTDHMAWPFSDSYISPIRMDVSQLEEYAETIDCLKEEYAGRIRVHLGAECEYFPDHIPWLIEEKERLNLEYLILGVHVPPNEQGHRQFACSVTPAELDAYTELAAAGMESGVFTYLCHPDLPLKSYPAFDNAALKMSEALCSTAKRLNIPLEYNLAGLRMRASSSGWGYTSDEFWQIAADKGCTAIIASDAHTPEDLCDTTAFDAVRRRLTNMGITVLDMLPELDREEDFA